MAGSKHRWAIAVAALLPMAACTADRDEDELPESRVPEYEVTIPEVDVDVLSKPNEKLQGVGEIVMGVTGGAIVNAIARACGRRVRQLPIGDQLTKKA